MELGIHMKADVLAELANLRDQAYAAGWLPSDGALRTHIERFKEEFGIERLRSIHGQDLLYLLHRRGGTERSMVYWLEYKNDSEFSGNDWFGGIGGGSALKFGMYHRQPGDSWMSGSPQRMHQISLDQAIGMAGSQRDELVGGSEVLRAYREGAPSDEKYMALQADMEKAAPTLHDDGWAHKYWSLLHPETLDFYHSPSYQRYHLYKLLQLPPLEEGILSRSQAPRPRFICAGRFVETAKALDLSTAALCMLLNRRDGAYRRYWRVGTTVGSDGDSNWEEMLDNNIVSIGWKNEVFDLSNVIRQQDDRAKADIRSMLAADYVAQTATRKAGEILNFAKRIQESDIVLACEGQRVRGIGRVVGPYGYEASLEFPHLRPVEWLSLDEWALPSNEGARTTVFPLGTHAGNLLELEARIAAGHTPVPRTPARHRLAAASPAPVISAPEPVPPLDKISGWVDAILRRKGQVVLYGPPGTGKTLHATNAARELAARQNFNLPYTRLDADQQRRCGEHYIRTCTFHPGWGYEHFIEGLRPSVNENGSMVFVPQDGIFKRLCADASQETARSFYLVIDEINRGDLPRIFGELITTIEISKRDQAVTLPVTQQRFSIPPNVFLIGTMNTADRSVSLMDTALRRRFGFIELMPDSSLLAKLDVGGLRLGAWLDALNERLRHTLKRDARSMQIGHAYLMPPPASVADFARIVRDEVIPLLEEYCYDDFRMLAQILGNSIVDIDAACIRDELFEPERERDLIQALQFQEMQDRVLDQEPTQEEEDALDAEAQDDPAEP